MENICGARTNEQVEVGLHYLASCPIHKYSVACPPLIANDLFLLIKF